jgi:hypothetical protein
MGKRMDHRRADDDLWDWAVIGLCFAGTTAAVWGTFLWHYMYR